MRKIDRLSWIDLSRSQKRVDRLRASRAKLKKRGFHPPLVYKTIGEPFICRFMRKMGTDHKSRFFRVNNGKVKITVPRIFCFLTNPDESLQFLYAVSKTLEDKNVVSVTFDHSKTKKYSLGAEAFLGILAKQYRELRDKSQYRIESINGIKSKNSEHNALLNQIGIIKELGAIDGDDSVDTSLIHLFKKQCLLRSSSSRSGDDEKTKAAEKFVQHIEKCLNDHKLSLKSNASDAFKGTLGEILDNAEEHCAGTAPRWYVRGYVNNGCENKMLELAVFNFGASIAETFQRLPNDHFSWETVSKYINNHKHIMDVERLITVAALQLRVSSKNETEDDDRGQGTIKLIELFESLYNEYKDKCPTFPSEAKDHTCEMSILSGGVYVRFDGTYELKDSEKELGGIVLPFNKSKLGLKSAPDPDYVVKMECGFFPGVFINIRVPMTRNVDKMVNEDKAKSNE